MLPPACGLRPGSSCQARGRARCRSCGGVDAIWEYGAWIDARDVAGAVYAALRRSELTHLTALIVADGVTSPIPPRELARRLLPDVPWRGPEPRMNGRRWSARIAHGRHWGGDRSIGGGAKTEHADGRLPRPLRTTMPASYQVRPGPPSMTVPKLLNDDQMQRFVAHGYLCLRTELPDAFDAASGNASMR